MLKIRPNSTAFIPLERPKTLEEVSKLVKLETESTGPTNRKLKKPKGRILMISEHADPIARPGSKEVGGQNVYVYNLARQLGRLGWQVDVYTRWDSANKLQTVKFGRGARVIRVKCGPRHYILRDDLYHYLPEFVDNIVSYKREHGLNYDLIHTHYWMSGWIGLKLRNLWDIPMAVTYHSLGQVRYHALRALKDQPPPNNFFAFRTYWERELALKGDLILSTSPFEIEDLHRYYTKDHLNVGQGHAGIDFNYFYPVNKELARRKIKQPVDRLVILYAGRIEWRKGIETLIRSFSLLLQQERYKETEIRLVIAGRTVGPEKSEVDRLKKIAQELQISQRITFVGSIDRSNMKYYYSAADVTVVPSYYEPFGQIPLEAFACHCPVVASAVGGLPYTVKPGVNGYLVPARDEASLADKIDAVLAKPEQLKKKVINFAQTELAERFAWPNIAKNFERMYQEIINLRKNTL